MVTQRTATHRAERAAGAAGDEASVWGDRPGTTWAAGCCDPSDVAAGSTADETPCSSRPPDTDTAVHLQRKRKVTHAHPFNGPLPGTTQVSRYQKGKTNLDFTEARGSEWQWQQLGHMQVCTSLQTDNHSSTPPLSFLKAGCPSYRPTNSVKALKRKVNKQFATSLTPTGTRIPYGITQCYLPAGRGDIPALTPAKLVVLDLVTRKNANLS